jgi:predicted phage terminase large subunit-like protein
MLKAGRGFGKTRVGAEWTKEQCLLVPGRYAIVAPTFSDARDTCIEGDSGLRAICPQSMISTYNRSMGELEFFNGSRVKLFSADEPDRMRGPQHHGAWCDELAAWRYEDAWDQLLFGLRLGECPRVVITTTPRPTALVRKIVADSNTIVTGGSTFDNAANLAPSALAALKAKYEGTRLGRQELYAEMLDDTLGALWTQRMLEDARTQAIPELKRIVVALDPAISANEGSDETGIIVAGLGVDGLAYVLDDLSLKGSPDEWARKAVSAYAARQADRIVAESNQGGEMVRQTLKTVDPTASIKLVHASKGKHARAEPVAALYEQGRVKHALSSPKLEDQLTTYAPGISNKSPDRLDALVWALTDLMLGNVAPEPSIRRL